MASNIVQFSKEEMHYDLQGVMMRLVGFTLWASREKAALRLIGTDRPDVTWASFDTVADGENLRFAISAWPVTDVFDVLYDFAVEGLARRPMAEFMNDASAYLSAALVYDLTNSVIAPDFGPPTLGDECLHIVRLATARGVLEGYKREFKFSLDDESGADDHLTIREVALLAGMEEASVRNAANPKLTNPLVTKKIGNGTFVAPADAKAWLDARGKYTPLQTAHGMAIDIAKSGFKTPHEVWTVLNGRAEACGLSLDRMLGDLGLEFPHPDMPEPAARKLATQLGYDDELFVLRMKELQVNTESIRIRHAIEAAASKVKQ